MMLRNILDKFLFGAFLLIALQVPILADHYGQFISGYFESTKMQVEGYEATAAQHGFANVKSMIDVHLANAEASVRTDAQQKLNTLQAYEDLKTAQLVFAQGNIFQKTGYMFNPARFGLLKKVLANFNPGVPLSVEYFIYAFLIALLLSSAIVGLFGIRMKRKVA
jgi:hypothetical protein